jgi:hypothetical protein
VLKRKTLFPKKASTPAQTGKTETEALNRREIVKDYFAYMDTPY